MQGGGGVHRVDQGQNDAGSVVVFDRAQAFVQVTWVLDVVLDAVGKEG